MSAASKWDAATLEGLLTIIEVNHLTDALPDTIHDPSYTPPDVGYILFQTNIVLASITFVVVLLRFWTRIFIAGGIGADDYAIGGAMVVMVGSTALNCYGVRNAGVGRHYYDLSTEEFVPLLKFMYALPVLYTLGIVSIKLSLLFFYRRLFRAKLLLTRLTTFLTIFEVLFCIGSILTFLLVCSPPSSWWSLTAHAHDCLSFTQTHNLYVSLRAVAVGTDIAVLALPLPLILRLQIPLRQRLGLAALLSMGSATCILATARLVILPRLLLHIDVSWNVLPVALLDQAESCLGIWTASVPALTALLKHHRRNRSTVTLHSSSTRNHEKPDFLAWAYDPEHATGKIGCVTTAYYAGGSHGGELWREDVIFKDTTVTVSVSSEKVGRLM